MDRTRRIPLLFAVVAGVLALGGPASQAAPAKKPTSQTVPGDLLVGFQTDVTSADQQRILKSVGADEKKSWKTIHGSLAHIASGDVDAAIAKLSQDPRVRYAEPNHVITIESLPNDPAFANTWGLNNTGQTINGSPGTPDADIDAPEAWNVTTGSSNVSVAVIDTGVDWSHPELSSQIWINPGENCSGCRNDGVDNDHNGFVDDWHGWDFVGNDNNPTDDHGHGTHVAGTIGAAGNNGAGVAGVNWNVRIMPVKFLNAQGSGTDANAVSAVLYAAQNGADVMNNSWADNQYSQTLADAINVADQNNSLFVAAAGNNGTDNDSSPTYPASYDMPNVVAVAATDNSDNRAFFSNVGRRSVDLGAPGVDIYSTWPGGNYQYLSGTSMATPHVAGAAALAKAAFPSASAVGLKALLLGTVDPKPALATTTSSGGRLNIGNAVACSATPQVWIDAPGPGFLVDVGTPVSFSAMAANCANPGGVTVSATANGAPVSLTARGDGLYTGTFTPTTGGAVTFSVTAGNGTTTATRSVTGSARSSLSISPGGPPVTVTSVTGESIPLKFNGTAGERVSLALTNVTMLIAQVSIVSPSGASLSSTYAGGGGGFVDTTTLPTAGAYTINVAPLAGSTGSVTLQLYDVPPDVAANATPGGSPVSFSTTTPGQNARVAFSGSAGQRISVNITNATFQFALLSILKPDGSALGNNRFIGPGSTFIDTVTLPSAGAYSIVINPNGASTGAATVEIYDVPPDAGGPITPSGAPVTVATAVPGQNGRLTFAGTAGQRVSLKISNVSYSSATAQMLDPSGNAVGGSVLFGTGGGFVDTRTLPSTGNYSITIDPPNTTTGSATFTLYNVPPDVTGTVTPGSSFVTSISTPGQNASYTFDGTAGQRISLKIGPSTMSMGYVSLTGPGGIQVVSRTLFSSFETFVDARALPTTGTYTLTVDPYNDATGFAMVALYNVPADASASLTIGGPAQSISIVTAGQNGRVTFVGQAGRAVTISLTNITIPISFVSILKPDGTPLVTNQLVGAFPKTIPATPTVDGAYTIVIDPQGTATGSMTLAAS
jgi:subtilase family protein/fervidolysin-like protein